MVFCICSMFCCALLCVLSGFAVILVRRGWLVALLCLSFWCLVAVVVLWLFLKVPWGGLQCVSEVFPNHTHLLFIYNSLQLPCCRSQLLRCCGRVSVYTSNLSVIPRWSILDFFISTAIPPPLITTCTGYTVHTYFSLCYFM